MDIELIEIRDFLQAHPPFNRLDQDTLARLPGTITVCYLRCGDTFPPAVSNEPVAYLVRQGAIELHNSSEQQVEVLDEGDIFFESCEQSEANLPAKGVARNDALLYQIPCHVIDELRHTDTQFDKFFSRSPTERFHHALQLMQEHDRAGLLTVHCGDLIRRSPVVVTHDTTIRRAAELMTEQRISALLISIDGRVAGIITDRDLRVRCLAKGLPTDTPVSTIMTTPLHQLPADTTGYEALLAMTRQGVHHLPIAEKEQIIGMITANDLLHHQSLTAVQLVSNIRRSTSLEGVVEQAKALPELQRHWVAAGISGHDLGKGITTVIDAITLKLLELAEAELGKPPVPYTWLVFGSQARHEQSAHTDQDNGLLMDDSYAPEHAPYFEALANFVTTALDRCGITLCAGDVMASNPKWRQPFSQWQRYFNEWVSQPEPMALMHLSIFFDLRALHGATHLADKLRTHLLSLTRNNSLFLAYLTANALHHRPPLGLFRQFVLIKSDEHHDTLDLKLNGIIPVVDLARVHALATGSPALSSHERLKATLAEGVLSEEAVNNLLDVLELLLTLRARHQAEQIRRNMTPDNFLAPQQLSSFERRHLKDAFGVIATLQSALAQRYQSERFG